jgi:hypothetical protein
LKKKDLKGEIRHDKEIQRLKAEAHILKIKNNQLLKEVNAHERLIEYNKMAIDALPPVRKPYRYYTHKRRVRESAVLVGSCWHIGETVNKQQMGGLNEYNFDIFVRRYQMLIEKTIKFTITNMSSFIFDELHIFLTGDMVSGTIHDEIEASNQLNIVEQATLGAFVTAQGISELARHFPQVIVTCVVGNHGRIKKRKYYKNKQQVNWDYIFYTNLSLLLKKQRNVKFNIPMSFWAGIEVQGHKFLIMHGDNIKSWGSIPFYGINREVAKWIEIKASQKEFFRYFIGSHYHTKAILQSPTGEKILNASLKGGDEYAMGLGFYGDPIQLLFGVHKKYGKSWELSINTKNPPDVVRYRYDRSKPIGEQ